MPTPVAPFFQAPSSAQAVALARAEPQLDYTTLCRTIQKLREGSPAPADAKQRAKVMALCRAMLNKMVGGHKVVLVQADAASSLCMDASNVAHCTTWSLPEDSEMVSTPEDRWSRRRSTHRCRCGTASGAGSLC